MTLNYLSSLLHRFHRDTIYFISFGYIAADPRIFAFAKTLRSHGFKIRCLNITTSSHFNQPSSSFCRHFSVKNLYIHDSDVVILDGLYAGITTYDLFSYLANPEIAPQRLSSSPQFIHDASLSTSDQFYLVRALYCRYCIHKLPSHLNITSNTVLFGTEFFWGSFIAYYLSILHQCSFISDIKEIHHDMEPHTSTWLKKFVSSHESTIYQYASQLPVVSRGILNLYKERYPELNDKLFYIPNTPTLSDNSCSHNRSISTPTKQNLRAVLFCHYIRDERGVEYLVRLWSKCHNEVSLTLYLSGLSSYDREYLFSLYTGPTHLFSIKNPISTDKINKTFANYDIGIIPYDPSLSLSYKYCSPNKFGQYVANGLAVISTNTANVPAYINEYQLGTVIDSGSFTDSASSLSKFLSNTSRILEAQKNSLHFFQNYFFFERFVSPISKSISSSLSRIPPTLYVLHSVPLDKPDSVPVTVLLSLQAFSESKFTVKYLYLPDLNTSPQPLSHVRTTDAVIFHYYAQVYTVFSPSLTHAISRLNCKKIFFAQDDYDYIQRNLNKYLDCKADFIYSPISDVTSRNYLYPPARIGPIKIRHYLTGYLPALKEDPSPISDRPLHIFYRGNDVGWAYGSLGQEKYTIGIDMLQHAIDHSLQVDISSSFSDQLYGSAYFTALSTAKATLITESGSSVLHNTDNIMHTKQEIISLARTSRHRLQRNDIHKLYPDYLSVDGTHVVAEISPKAFEAIVHKTALIAFNGHYSGVLKPHQHFIPLEKDFSNVRDVIELLKDNNFLQDLVDRTYNDIVVNGRYTYPHLIRELDDVI